MASFGVMDWALLRAWVCGGGGWGRVRVCMCGRGRDECV